MHKFTRNFLTEWRKLKLPFENETFVIAVSGGADSVGLLLVLSELREAKKLNLNLIAAHYNHDLRGAASEADAAFVEDLVKKLAVEFIGGSPKPEARIQNQKGNLEQSARRARYDFLLRAAEKYNAFGVLTAHTLNDQAETFLLNLIRGSGLDGLGAMRAIRDLEFKVQGSKFKVQKSEADESEIRNPKSKILLVRPLLDWAKRVDTESFAREREIEFRLDAMNDDESFARVRVRKKVIPLLSELNPKIVETLAQTARLLRGDAEQLSAVEVRLPENPSVKELKLLSKSTLYRILRSWLERERGDLRKIDLRHVAAIENLIFSRKSGRAVELPAGASVIKRSGKLYFKKSKVEKSRLDN